METKNATGRKERQIVLASASPRRRALLALMGLTFQVLPSEKEEIVTGDSPEEIVKNLSFQKAEDVTARLSRTAQEDGQEPDVIVIGSDTIVVCDGDVMGKPHTEEEAFAMLQRLQGRSHVVYTGVTVMSRENNKITHDTFAKSAVVTVHAMDDAEIRAYIAKGESMDKAGAYGIQGSFAVFVDSVEGEYNTVLGLPVAALYQALKRFL